MLSAADIRSRVRARLRGSEEDSFTRMPDLRGVTGVIAWRLTVSNFQTDLAFFDVSKAIWPRRYVGLLAWKRTWFVHVDPDGSAPHFTRTDALLDPPGEYIGPFQTGRSAQKFISTLEDMFDLCREVRCLRLAAESAIAGILDTAGAPRCSYGQMGRCVCVCDGTMPMPQYRKLIRDALAFAQGDRQPLAESLRAGMRQAADSLQFERAGALKAKLDRMAEFDRPEYSYVRNARDLGYLLLQASGSRRRLMAFYARPDHVTKLDDLAFPLQPSEMDKLLDRLAAQTPPDRSSSAQPSHDDAVALAYRMGLVAHYLFAPAAKQGVIIPLPPGPPDCQQLSAQIAEQIALNLAPLHLSAPADRHPKESSPGESAPV